MARITYNKMAKLFHRLEISYKAGIDLVTAYKKERQIGGPSDRLKANRVVNSLKDGNALATAMKSLDGYFPELAIAVVMAGEAGGRLDESFGRLANHYKSLVEFRSNFLRAISWPVFQLAVCVLLVGIMIPLLNWVMGEELAIDWFGMGSTTGNLLLYIFVVTFFFGSLAVLIIGSIKGWFGTLPMRIARRVPLLGKTIECLALSRMAWTMSVAENAGMDALENARLSLGATENYFYESLEEEVCEDLRSGETFYKTYQATDAFPQDYLDYIDVGETAGELAETMDRASRDLQAKADQNMQILSKIGFALTFAFVAVVIGGTVIMMYQRMYIDTLKKFL